MSQLGRIASIHRYPVKSMLGETTDAARIADRGLLGDRTHALLDVTSGRIASAKQPSLWRRLLQCTATRSSDGTSISIQLPSGELLSEDDAALNDALSSFLEREVRVLARLPEVAEIERADPDEVLAHGFRKSVTTRVLQLAGAAPKEAFVDFAPVHLITSATLAEISRVAGEPIETIRYRPNLVIDTPDLAPFAENAWVGQTIKLGREIQLQVILATPRCAVPTLSHGDLPPRPAALKTVAKLNSVEFQEGISLPCVGVHARVLSGGTLTLGDEVALS